MTTCDTCDTNMINAKPAPALTDRQRRFLEAYQSPACRVAIAPAARLAGVHRATVYRWLRDAAFRAALRAAADVFFRENKARVLRENEARQRWREERERERRPMRCEILARAREARRQS